MKKRAVVVFKSESPEYSASFDEAGFSPTFVEALQFERIGAERLAERLRRDSYAGLVLTSPRAVDALAEHWDEAARRRWGARAVYAVGPGTAARAAALGVRARGAAAGNAAALAEAIAEEGAAGALLFPCGETRSAALETGLRERGVAVEALEVYRTAEHADLARAVRTLARLRAPAGMVLCSPWGAERVLARLEGAWAGVPAVGVGAATAARARALGHARVAQAAAPTARAVVAALALCLDTAD